MGQISALTAWLILAAEVGAVFIILTTAHDPLTVSVGFSILAGITTWYAIPALSEIFVKAGLKGMDLSKKSKHIIPESMGMVAGLIFLVTMFVFIPFPFMKWFTASRDGHPQELTLLTFPNLKLAELLSALLSIQSMVFLGFADDVLDIRWRFKMPLPAIAAIPLLMVYWVNNGVTYIVVPIPLRPLLGQLINLGALYYVYMAMVAIFCTHSINIMAGINGVEVGQSLVIACSIAFNDMLFLQSSTTGAPAIETHLFSLYFILPFIGVSTGLLAHYSKTLLLFFIPQIFNFLLSSPQLFRLVPCPRHRVPRYNRSTNLMEPSRVVLDQEELDTELSLNGKHHLPGHQPHAQPRQGSLGRSPSAVSLSATTGSVQETRAGPADVAISGGPEAPPSPASLASTLRSIAPSSLIVSPSSFTPPPNSTLRRPGWVCIKLFEALGLTVVRYDVKTGKRPLEMTNLTILNLILVKAGPMSERNLTLSVMLIQVVCSLIAFLIRHRLVAFVYDVV